MTNTNATPTPQGFHCPECECEGKKVKRITLEALLTPDAALRIGEGHYRFCDSIDCKTVYFGDNRATFSKGDLAVRVGVKERAAPRPVCYCFGHTIEEIDAEVRETGQSTVLDDIRDRLKIACWCETKNPQGSCCLGTVGTYVKQAMVEHGHRRGTHATDEEQTDCRAAAAHIQSPCESDEIAMHNCCSTTDADVDGTGKGRRTGMLAAGGSVLSAFAASACCWIPLVLIAFGVSAGGVSAWFAQYRWLFLSLTTTLLGTGFYFVYFRKQYCAPGSACAASTRGLQRFNRVMLWVATAIVIVTAAFPKYVGYLISGSPVAQIADPTGEWTAVSIGIEGMTCEACAVNLRNVLVNVPGVHDASVSYTDGSATIRFEASAAPSKTDLVSAVADAGYKADTSAMNK